MPIRPSRDVIDGGGFRPNCASTTTRVDVTRTHARAHARAHGEGSDDVRDDVHVSGDGGDGASTAARDGASATRASLSMGGCDARRWRRARRSRAVDETRDDDDDDDDARGER